MEKKAKYTSPEMEKRRQALKDQIEAELLELDREELFLVEMFVEAMCAERAE